MLIVFRLDTSQFVNLTQAIFKHVILVDLNNLRMRRSSRVNKYVPLPRPSVLCTLDLL